MKSIAAALSFMFCSVAYAECTSTFITVGGKTVVCISCPDTKTVICN